MFRHYFIELKIKDFFINKYSLIIQSFINFQDLINCRKFFKCQIYHFLL